MVQIKCKNCGRMAESSTFVIDAIIGKLVCPQCVKDRKMGHHPTTTNQPMQNSSFTGPGTSMPGPSSGSSSGSIGSSPSMSRPAASSNHPSQPQSAASQQAKPGQFGDLTSMMLNKKPSANATPFNPMAKPQSQPSARPSVSQDEDNDEPIHQPQKTVPTFGGSNRNSQAPTQVSTSSQRGGGVFGLFGKKEQPVQRGSMNNMESVQSQTPSKAHPADWDADDAALERMPQRTAPDRAPKLDETHVQLTCSKCNYKIKYDVYKEQPGNCPYCGREIDKSSIRY